MNPQRLAIIGSVATVTVCLVYLLGWWLLWRVMVAAPPPGMLFVLPVTAVGCVLIAGGVIAAVRRVSERGIRAWGVGVIALAAVVLAEYALGLSLGLETYIFGDEVRALLGGDTPGRPAPQAALIMLFLGLALWFLARPHADRYNLADLGIGIALFMSFTILLGHLYQARSLYQTGTESIGMSLIETLMMLALALGALSVNPNGAIASFAGRDAVGAAKRRALPVIVLAPLLLGLLQHLSVKLEVLELPVALALAVTANIVVFLVLAEWVGRLLVRIDEERTGVFAAREKSAKEQGMTDTLTGLLNRRGWDQAVAQAEARCQREGLNACIVVIDLDGLKRINDTLGHAKGDEFIRRAGSALRLAARREDSLARLGGDEFAYLSVGCAPEHAGMVRKRLADALQKASVPASVGYFMRDLAGSIGAAFQEADQAMYAHKRERKAQAAPRQTVA